MGAAPLERVEVQRQRRHQRLALAGLHLGDPSLVEHDAPDELHVVVAHPEPALGRLADHGERLGKQLGESLGAAGIALGDFETRDLGFLGLLCRGHQAAAFRRLRGLPEADVRGGDLEALAELLGLGAQLLVAELGDLLLEVVDLVDHRLVALHLALGGVAEDGVQQLEVTGMAPLHDGRGRPSPNRPTPADQGLAGPTPSAPR